MLKNSRLILGLALPSITSFAAGTATGTINLIMVGQLGALAIAIVGVSNIIMYNSWALFSGIGHTVNYLVAQNYGSNNMKKGIERTYIAFYLCGLACLLLLLATFFIAPTILNIMGDNNQLAKEGTAYLQIRFIAMLFSVFTFALHGFFRGIGDTKTPMITSILGNVLMIFFTYSLTYGHFGFDAHGLAGAGAAVLIGELTIFLTSAYWYFIKLHPIYKTRSKNTFDLAEFKLIVGESSKLGVQEFSMSMAMFIFTIFVSYLGTVPLAANEVALNIMSFGFMPAFGFGSTATILVGQEVGKGRPLKGRSYGTETAILGSIFLLILGTIEFIFASPITKIFTDDPEVYHLATNLIMISAFLQIFDGLLNFYAGCLRGIGETTFLLKLSIISGWLIFVPLTYLLTFVLDLASLGAWFALYAHLTFFGIAVMIRFYRTDWLNLKMREVKTEQLAAKV